MDPQKTLHNNRYPGIRSFERKDKNLFYGRNKEIEELFHYIKIKALVVLFGKSGLGKTSLLKAGVGPLLIKQGFFPLVIRLQDVEVAPVTTVLTALEPFVDSEAMEKFGGKSGNKIWEALQATKFTGPDGKTATPVLVFDQFEELFNHPPAVQEEWASFIGDIIEERVPRDIEGAIYKIPRAQRSKELMNWYTPRPLRVVFAIRSDRMSELHQLRFEIPAILQNRYELKPLNIRQAKDAIEKPAALTGKHYSTAPFSFAPETIEKIQKELSNELNEIESFQLQIVCQHIEQKVKEQQKNSKAAVVVTPDYLGDKTGIKDILKNYYKTQLGLLGSEKEQLAARKLLEEGLIMNKRRIGVAEAVVQETYNIDDDLLGKLLNSRLIRPEDTRLGRTYEISHDTLVKPILEAYEKRRVQEERMAVREKQRKEEKEALRRKKVRNLTIVGVLLAGLTAIAFYQSFQARAQTKIAQSKAIMLADTISALSIAREKTDSFIQVLAEEFTEKDNKIQKLLDFASNYVRDTANIMIEIDTILARKERVANLQYQSQLQKKKEIREISDKLFSSSESTRSKSAYALTRKFSAEADLPDILISKAEGNINKKNINTIYQIIYVLENTESKALIENKGQVQEFIKEVKDSKLVGPATQTRLNRIENKLN